MLRCLVEKSLAFFFVCFCFFIFLFFFLIFFVFFFVFKHKIQDIGGGCELFFVFPNEYPGSEWAPAVVSLSEVLD